MSYLFLHYCFQSICTPYSRFVQVSGKTIPDIPIPQNIIQSSSVSKTGYATLTLFLHQQGRSPDSLRWWKLPVQSIFSKPDRSRRSSPWHKELHSVRKWIKHYSVTCMHSAQVTEHLFNISTIKKQFVRGTTNLEIIAAASLFELDVYIATETYRVGFPTWLVYAPRPVSNRRWLLSQLESKLSITNKRSRIAELLHVSGCHVAFWQY